MPDSLSRRSTLTFYRRHPADGDVMAWLHERAMVAERAALGMDRKPLGLFIRDMGGVIQAGAVVWLYGPDAYIHVLWVDAPWRGKGLGAALLVAAENAAIAAGANRLYLSTMGFQGPDFYPRYGFESQGVFADFTWGHDRHYFSKAPLSIAPALPLPAGLFLHRAEAPDAADIAAVENGLDAHWYLTIPDPYTELTVEAVDGGGIRVAAGLAVLDGAYLTLVDLAVVPLWRGKGLGRQVLGELERLGAEAGCRWATVMPMDYQSPGFFRHLGYARRMRVDNYLLGQGRDWLRRAIGDAIGDE
ncbi:GNAT family N-acetyltransferase [Niveispirillum sp.]|uniref:GNAT family N-acetyltransferase n=1 Tax=Niveispirillum sp. TaxID=1917217 RepID=UPI001B498593|nr:GNAT family N-acetyltransferase [Niveispirillum sp.]MBP7336971.1 GNAT family N-acetyltransferase [Niveispirillum sp.]